MAALLSSLRAALPGSPEVSADASKRPLEWHQVSSGVLQLREAAERELAALEARAATVDAQLSAQLAVFAGATERSEVEAQVQQVERELRDALPKFQAAESHVERVATRVRPQTERLAGLEARAAFFSAALEVEKRGQAARKRAVEATPEALESFTAFSAFVHALPDEYAAIKQQATRRLDLLAVDLRCFGLAKLQRALDGVDWPTPTVEEGEDQEKQEADDKLLNVAEAFSYLVTLQLSQQGGSLAPKSPTKGGGTTRSLRDDSLWAMDCVMDAVLVRFRYHFEREDSATNRLAKPEWMFLHILEQVRTHARFANKVLTPELRKHREALHCYDARILMLRSLITAAQRQLSKSLPTLVQHPPLLCHTIDEVLIFESTLDDEFDYGAYSDSTEDRWRYPRCVDALTADPTVLFAWTKADVEYSLQLLTSRAANDSDRSSFSPDKRSDIPKVWQLPAHIEADRTSDQDAQALILVPPIALDVVLLLDFLSQRFNYMGNDEHRYLYVVHVFHGLLKQFSDSGKARGEAAVANIVKALRVSAPAGREQAWRELFAVVNALQHIKATLATWEQTSIFLELSNKLARSETSRSHVLKLHVAYSQTRERLATAAKAASEVVLASEEATAVRQALTGPGSMIGPTAAFSAAYAVGSKTMKNLFGTSSGGQSSQVSATYNNDSAAPGTPGDSPRGASGLREATGKTSAAGIPDGEAPQEGVDDAEAMLLFSHSMFERQIEELKSVISTLMKSATDALSSGLFAREMQAYRSSSLWGLTEVGEVISLSVSSEIAQSFTLTRDIIALANRCLLPDCVPLLWKPLATALDTQLFGAFVSAQPPLGLLPSEGINHAAAIQQLGADLDALMQIFSSCGSHRTTRSYLRKTSDLSQLLALPPSKLGELKRAFDEHDSGDSRDEDESDDYDGTLRLISKHNMNSGTSPDAMEQLTTMLEACGVLTLTPSQVLALLEHS